MIFWMEICFCIRGYNFDGHNFIDLALSKELKLLLLIVIMEAGLIL